MPDRSKPLLQDNVPDYVRKYYEVNEVKVFSFSRPFKKQKTGNEFLDLWTSKTEYTILDGCVLVAAARAGGKEESLFDGNHWMRSLCTRRRFPSLLRRCKVVNSTTVELAPIQNALVRSRAVPHRA